MNHNLRFFFEDFITELYDSNFSAFEEGATNDDGQSYNSEYSKKDEDDIDDMPYKVISFCDEEGVRFETSYFLRQWCIVGYSWRLARSCRNSSNVSVLGSYNRCCW
ncbi:hypothetical protein P8452_47590 [Trifolium repens]|nr:hypothetical protein P8452_47590 [Trifolium repens]